MGTTTARGVPQPAGPDSNDAALWLQRLAAWVNDRPGIATLSTTQRNALAPAEVWAGRVIWNTTAGRHERYDGSSWVGLDARTRFVTATRSSSAPYDNYTGVATLLGATWPSAPAGAYLLHSTVALAGLGTVTGAYAKFTVGAITLAADVRLDLVDHVYVTHTHVHPYLHAGGNLAFVMQHDVGGQTASIWNNNASRATIQYLGQTA